MKDFIPCNEALELKELGFNEECFGWYNYGTLWLFREDNLLDSYAGEENRPLAPTFSQAFRFFREKYEYIIHIFRNSTSGKYSWKIDDRYSYVDYTADIFNTYEEAELACLQKLIQIVKDEKHTRITN